MYLFHSKKKTQSASDMGVPPLADFSPTSSRSSGSLRSARQPDASGDNNSARSDSSRAARPKGLHLVSSEILFPTLCKGESAVLKILLKNPTSTVKQITVEQEPQPPFLIKHHSFTVREDKMMMFPVTFKPLHVAKFKDKIVFRENESGQRLCAVVEAQCSQ
ncbi:centrosomal protein of 192 kDa-like [Aplysia californica]|uniref:Centrosomal protein of 192 kDa-like n=1 Tax=Aplysia californica TaxID=6500 RepID=A0ABM1VPB4_APLCA|nr:centrosomal protein of 192 kDa-like [Aplysia californica]